MNWFSGKAHWILLILVILIIVSANRVFAEEVDTTKAVIHHTATRDVSIEVIRKYHIEHNGWSDVGYHYLIRANGTIETGRSLAKKGAHAVGRNEMIGIALTGYDIFTEAQLDALKGLLKRLGVVEIQAHHSACPGKGLDLAQIQSDLNLRLAKKGE